MEKCCLFVHFLYFFVFFSFSTVILIFVCLVFHNFVRCFSNKTLSIFPLLLSFFHIYITFFHILFFSFVFKLYLYSKYPISGIFLFYFLHFDIFNVKIRYRAIKPDWRYYHCKSAFSSLLHPPCHHRTLPYCTVSLHVTYRKRK